MKTLSTERPSLPAGTRQAKTAVNPLQLLQHRPAGSPLLSSERGYGGPAAHNPLQLLAHKTYPTAQPVTSAPHAVASETEAQEDVVADRPVQLTKKGGGKKNRRGGKRAKRKKAGATPAATLAAAPVVAEDAAEEEVPLLAPVAEAVPVVAAAEPLAEDDEAAPVEVEDDDVVDDEAEAERLEQQRLDELYNKYCNLVDGCIDDVLNQIDLKVKNKGGDTYGTIDVSAMFLRKYEELYTRQQFRWHVMGEVMKELPRSADGARPYHNWVFKGRKPTNYTIKTKQGLKAYVNIHFI